MTQLRFADHIGLDYLIGRATLTVEDKHRCERP